MKWTTSGSSAAKETEEPGDQAVKVGGQGTCGERESRLQERKPYLKLAVRSTFFGIAGGLCFRYPVVIGFALLFLLYLLLDC